MAMLNNQMVHRQITRCLYMDLKWSIAMLVYQRVNQSKIDSMTLCICFFLIINIWSTLWKIAVSWDDDIPNLWKNKQCSKPPTRYGWICIGYLRIYSISNNQPSTTGVPSNWDSTTCFTTPWHRGSAVVHAPIPAWAHGSSMLQPKSAKTCVVSFWLVTLW